jgi:uncharacterized protein YndB with AHSA1/START domain
MTRVPVDKQAAEQGAIVVRESVLVELPLEQAFALFTEGINEWWPLEEGYSFGGDMAREVHLEPWVEGRLYERWVEGEEFQTGRVIECDRPHRIVFTWRDEHERGEMEVEVRFTPEGEGTRVTVEHRGFERLGPGGEELAARYAGGWPRVLQAFTSGSHRGKH